MHNNNFKYIYGPVESWRMGKSLGIDPLSDSAKICNMDCVYCQLGRSSKLTNVRKNYVATQIIVDELEQFFKNNSIKLSLKNNIDFLTFSGRGEPTLAANLGEMIEKTRQIRKERVAVITNCSLLYLPEVQQALSMCDLVVAKMDAFNEDSFITVDLPFESINFKRTLEGLKNFRKSFHGNLAVQVMFIEENLKLAESIAEVVRDIQADEVQINTPLRPSGAPPIDEKRIKEVKAYFADLPAVTVYERERKITVPLDAKETIKRHGNYTKAIN